MCIIYLRVDYCAVFSMQKGSGLPFEKKSTTFGINWVMLHRIHTFVLKICRDIDIFVISNNFHKTGFSWVYLVE